MAEIFSYSYEDIQKFSNKVKENVTKSGNIFLPYADWQRNYLNSLFNQNNNEQLFKVNKYKKDEDEKIRIRISPDADELDRMIKDSAREIRDIDRNYPVEQRPLEYFKVFKEKIVPKEIILDDYPTIKSKSLNDGKDVEVPVWFNSTQDEVNIRPGLVNGDSRKPYSIPLNDKTVHMLLGGKTGSGKSVALNTIICNLLTEYAPWELDLYLCDFKIVELTPYATPIPAPHVKVVGATDGIEYIKTLFKSLNIELHKREAIFTALGVKDISEFRYKYNMVFPRIVIIVDEYAQMYKNLSKARSEGNHTADDDRRDINMYIAEFGTLGRAFGIHMLFSSQDLSNDLDKTTDEQFSVGVALASSLGVSNCLIKNDGGAKLTTKGKCIVNTERHTQSNERYNIMYQVPYLKSSLTSEEIEREKQGDLQMLLTELNKLANTIESQNMGLRVKKDVQYYDSRNNTLIEEFENDIKEIRDIEQRNRENIEFYDTYTFREIAIGRTTKYKVHSKVEGFALERKPNNSILICTDEDGNQSDMLKRLAMNFRDMKEVTHNIIEGNPIVSRMSNIGKILENSNITKRVVLPQNLVEKIKTREKIIDFSIKLEEELRRLGKNNHWSDELAVEIVSEDLIGENNTGFIEQNLYAIIEAISCNNERLAEDNIRNNLSIATDNQLDDIIDLIYLVIGYKRTIKESTNFEKPMSRDLFKPEMHWFIGLDEFTDITSEYNHDAIDMLKVIYEKGSQYNIFVITSTHRVDKIRGAVLMIKHILEKCDKEKVNTIEVPYKYNITPDTFNYHERNNKQNFKIIRDYDNI